MEWIGGLAYQNDIKFKTYWIIAWSVAGGLIFGVLFDQLSNFPQQFQLIHIENDVAGFKPKVFVGLLILGVTSFGWLLVLFQSFIDKEGDWWGYVQAPFLYAGWFGIQSVI